MDAMLVKLIKSSREEGDREGRVSQEFSTRLDGLCHALGETSGLVSRTLPAQAAAEFLQGLQTAQQIAWQAGENKPPPEPGSWSYILEPVLMTGSILTLVRAAPNEAEIGLQLDRSFNFHGIISLILGRGPSQQALSFDLEPGQAGWVLRRWDDDQPAQFRLDVPTNQAVPWATTALFEFWNQLLPASPLTWLGGLKQAVPPPAVIKPETPQAPLPQTVIMARPGAPLLTLCLVNQETGRVLPLKSRLTFGRDEQNDLHLDDRETSRNHATIEPAAGGWQIRDLNSTNGTWVNGNRISEAVRLAEGDVVAMGKTRFKVENREA